MYKPLLILKYLRKRRIAWASLVAVMLCTAMVIVVISVMGGWLRMFRASFQGMSGDVIVQGISLTGFPHYQEMIDKLDKLPQVRAAVPTIQTFGLINLQNKIRRGVNVEGYPMAEIGEVNKFPESLYLQHELYQTPAAGRGKLSMMEQDYLRQHPTPPAAPTLDKPMPAGLYEQEMPGGRTRDLGKQPGMIVGVGVANLEKDSSGNIPDRGVGIYGFPVFAYLTVLAVDPNNANSDIAGNKAEVQFVVVDDSRTGVFEADESSVYVEFARLQSMLKMDRRETKDLDTGQLYVDPARTRDVEVKLAPGVPLSVGKAAVVKVVNEVKAAHPEVDWDGKFPTDVQTWEETQARFLSAVEHEKALVTFLFSLISIVAVFLIFCIFYMIVMEKTRDIGIIKSVGATGAGVAAIFIGYGFVIGILGAGLGLLAGGLVVRYINQIHAAMGRFLGIQMWNAQTYAFDTIPNTMNPREVGVICAVAVLSSVIGALLPALRAARMNPVEALRFE